MQNRKELDLKHCRCGIKCLGRQATILLVLIFDKISGKPAVLDSFIVGTLNLFSGYI